MRLANKIGSLLIFILMLIPVAVILTLFLYPKARDHLVDSVVEAPNSSIPTWSDLNSSIYARLSPTPTRHHSVVETNYTAARCPISCANVGGCRC